MIDFLAKLTHWQGIDRAIGRPVANVNIFKARNIHAAHLASDLLGEKLFAATRSPNSNSSLSSNSPCRRHASTLTRVPLGRSCVIDAVSPGITPQFTTDRRGASTKQPGNLSLDHAM